MVLSALVCVHARDGNVAGVRRYLDGDRNVFANYFFDLAANSTARKPTPPRRENQLVESSQATRGVVGAVTGADDGAGIGPSVSSRVGAGIGPSVGSRVGSFVGACV